VEELTHGEAESPRARVRAERLRAWWKLLTRWNGVLARSLERTARSVLAHDSLNVAQSTAYSAIVAIFPALIVVAAVIGLLPDTAPVRFQLLMFIDRVMPPAVSTMLDAAFQSSPKHGHSLRALFTAAFVSFWGASNVIVTLMEGLRRAHELPAKCWSFWSRRRRAFELVPVSLVPLAVASLLVLFGHRVTEWVVPSVAPEVRRSISAVMVLLRWGVSLGASVGVIALVYYLGVPDSHLAVPGRWARWPVRSIELLSPHGHEDCTDGKPAARSWQSVLPGAVLATAMWFFTTLAFGWYVTRFANYSEVYGSLGAAVALLFWLYIVSLSVLCGAEFNVQYASQMHAQFGGAVLEEAPRAEISDAKAS